MLYVIIGQTAEALPEVSILIHPNRKKRYLTYVHLKKKIYIVFRVFVCLFVCFYFCKIITKQYSLTIYIYLKTVPQNNPLRTIVVSKFLSGYATWF